MARKGEEPTHGNYNKKICFVICPIGKDTSPERLWSDKILKYIIEPVASKKYKVIRADKISAPGMIAPQIIRYLKESEVVIADLTFHNPNVFYELAIRHVTKKPYIQLIKIGQEIPFDTATNRTIPIDIDVQVADDARKELEKQLESIESGIPSIDNPIAITDIILEAERTGNTDQITNAKIIEIISDIQSQLYGINRKVESVTRSGGGGGVSFGVMGSDDEKEKLSRLNELKKDIEQYNDLN